MINKSLVEKFHEEAITALNKLAEKYNLTKGRSHISYSDTSFKFTSEFKAVLDENEEQRVFEKDCFMYNIPRDYYGKTFDYKGDKWKFIGFEHNRRKFPLKCKNLTTDKVHLFTTEIVKILLKNS